jgi:hypothetical protein
MRNYIYRNEKRQREKGIRPFTSYSSVLPEILSQLFNPRQYFGKQPLVYPNLSHLKRDVSAVPDNLCTDLDELYKQAAKRPMFYFPWKNQPSQKVAQVIGQNKQPETHLIRDEPFA